MNWAARIPRTAAAALDGLRLRPSLEGLLLEETLWLRGETRDEELDQALRSLPGIRHFSEREGRLRPPGACLATEELPQGDWRPIPELVKPPAPLAAFAGELSPGRRLPISLVRSAEPARELATAAELLLCEAQAWRRYALAAPALRLAPLSFCCCDDEALVRGAPLPSIPGQRFYFRGEIALPLGMTWTPRVDPAALATLLDLLPGELALFRSDGEVERIAGECFLPARRASLRLSIPEIP